MGKSARKVTISIDPHRETPKNRWILLQKWGNQQPRNCNFSVKNDVHKIPKQNGEISNQNDNIHRSSPRNPNFRWILLQKWGNQQPRNCGEIESNALKYQFLAKKGKSAPRNTKQNAGTPESI